jgi:hypothetical protein
MSENSLKIHTGFRISRENIKFIETTGKSLGLNKTAVVDMLITIIRNNPGALKQLIQKAIEG